MGTGMSGSAEIPGSRGFRRPSTMTQSTATRPGSSTSRSTSTAATAAVGAAAATVAAEAAATAFVPPTIIVQTPSYVVGPPQIDDVTGTITRLAPLPDPASQDFLLSGGGSPNPTPTGNFATTTGAMGTSDPAAVQHPGGGGSTVADCMGLWDKSSHMSKASWKETCVRTLNGIDLPAEGLGVNVGSTGTVGTGVGAGFGVVPGVTPGAKRTPTP